jgi:hypothetical protein
VQYHSRLGSIYDLTPTDIQPLCVKESIEVAIAKALMQEYERNMLA